MTATLFPDFSVTVQSRRWACVLDPTLVLSDYGLSLVKHLGNLMELWVVREFWHILDNTHYYARQPRRSLQHPSEVDQTENQAPFSTALSVVNSYQPPLQVLQQWEMVRMATDLRGYNFYWIGDGPTASYLPEGVDADILWRWDCLASSLDRRWQSLFGCDDPLQSAYRDAVALAATLGSALILTHRRPEDLALNLPPSLCVALQERGIPCQPVPTTHPMTRVERHHLHQLLVMAGLSKLVWAGLNLTVLHVLVPPAASLTPPPDWTSDWAVDWASDRPLPPTPMDDAPAPALPIWDGARGFWYDL